jgi:hypothetical protein
MPWTAHIEAEECGVQHSEHYLKRCCKQQKFRSSIKSGIVVDEEGFRGNTSSEVAIPLLCFSLIWRTPMEEMITAGEVVSGFC